jgi:hypothetical protein
MIQSLRKSWNENQKELRRHLLKPDSLNDAIDLFLCQHGVLHTAAIAPGTPWSFADEVLADLNEEQIRRIPANSDHSIAWCFWHMARIEDVTMNVLVDGRPQLLHQESWPERMKIAGQDTGNAMDKTAIHQLSAEIDLDALHAYRLAVGRRTREIVSGLTTALLKQSVEPDRLQSLVDQGAVPPNSGLLSYWGNRTIAGLLLMPPTRHNFVHLNEALNLK